MLFRVEVSVSVQMWAFVCVSTVTVCLTKLAHLDNRIRAGCNGEVCVCVCAHTLATSQQKDKH